MFGVGTAFPHLFFGNKPLPASNNFWTKVQLSTKSNAFLPTNILLSLIICFSTYCTVFVIVAFRTKTWMNENLVIDSLQTSRIPLWRGKILSDHFQFSKILSDHFHFQCSCDAINTFQGTMPALLLLSSFLVCLSLRVPRAFFRGEGKLCLFSK